MQQNNSYYQQPYHPHLQNPNPNPTDFHPTSASAPPFSSSEYPPFLQNPSSYPVFPQPPPPDPTSPPPSNYNPNPNFQFAPAPEQQPIYSPYYPPFDLSSNPNSNPNAPIYAPPPPTHPYYDSVPPVAPAPVYERPSSYNSNAPSYLDENLARYGGGGYGRSRSDIGSDYYEKKPESSPFRYDRMGMNDDGFGGQEVYAYNGGKHEPYGARGTSGKSGASGAMKFDDYGRSVSFGGSGKDLSSSKVVKAVPKVETQQDVKNGVQKFRVKLLGESGGSSMDVLCQIGLDGIRMLDPSTGRMLRIYPLETVTRSEVTDSSIFTFWSKSSVDFEPRRIRLQSNSYTTNTILDTVTAATFQVKEMGRDSLRNKPSDNVKVSEQLNEKKKGLTDWMNIIKPGNEEKDHWVPDEAVTKCAACGTDFGAFVRKHHCRNCGDIFCDKCTQGRTALTADENAQPVRVCDRCMAEVTQRLNSAKESASRPASLRSHEDLAKKLQEEMERNRKSSSGVKASDGSGRRMREVACPTCTVHLQVQVPSSGSETIECGVCQHPFLVSAH